MNTGGYMAEKSIGISVDAVESKPNVKIVKLNGVLDALAISDVDKTIIPLISEGCHVIIDFQGLSYVNSIGLVAVIRYYARAKEKGIDLKIVGPNNIIKEMMSISGAFKLLEVEDNLENALNSLN